jgi:hypothetical protein
VAHVGPALDGGARRRRGLVATVATALVVARIPHTAVAATIGASFTVMFPMLLARPGLTAGQAARLRVVHRWCSVVVGTALYAMWRSGA